MKFEIRVAGILTQDDRVLLVEHHKGAHQRYWVLPGGHVQAGESLARALWREWQEELNLEVEVGKLVFVNDFISDSRQVLNLYFEVRSGSMRPSIKAQRDATVKQAKLFSPDELGSIPFRPNILPELIRYLKTGRVTSVYLGRR